jgi:hypothetical protein
MIKSQEDVKNEVKSKKKSVAERMKNQPLPAKPDVIVPPMPTSDISDIMDIFDERITRIEEYLEATSGVISSLKQIPEHINLITNAVDNLNAHVNMISDNMLGFAELEDNRYNELAGLITELNNTLIKLDQLIPSFVESKISELAHDKIKIGGEPLN